MKKFLIIGILLIITLITIYNIINLRASKVSGLPDKVYVNGLQTSNSQIVVNEQSSSKKSTFYLDMSRQEVVAKLKKMNIDILNEIEITSNFNAWDYGNKILWTELLDFNFDKDDILYKIDVNENIPTTLGLKAGDSFDDMQKIYGRKSILYQTKKMNIFEYVINNHYFWVYISKVENGKISSWAISKYRYNKK